jgi:acetolactate synthase-1/2/3 large subunit
VPEAGALWDEADVVLSIGSDLDGVQTQNWAQPQPPTLVTVNIDPEDAGKNYEPTLSLAGDARAVAAALAGLVPAREDGRDLEAIRKSAIERLRAEQPDEIGMLEAVEAALPDDAVLVVDMCIPGYWLAGFHRPPVPRKIQVPLGWGTLGYGFPALLGAALAGAGPAVAVVGDGGFLYAAGELATVAQERIPLTLVIVDDGGYGMLRFDQQLAGDPIFGVDLQSPDFPALAAAFGIESQTVDGVGEEFGRALAEHVARPEPTVLIAKARLDPPPNTSPRWYRRAVASRRGRTRGRR